MCRVRVSAKEPVKDWDSEGLLCVHSPVLCPDMFSGGRSTPTQQRLPSTLLPNSQQLRNSKVSPCLVGAGLGSEPGVSLEANCAQTAVVLANYLFHMGSCEIVISNNNISQPNSMQDIVS